MIEVSKNCTSKSAFTGQIWLNIFGKVNFDLTWVDSQFPLSLSPNSLIIRARKQRK